MCHPRRETPVGSGGFGRDKGERVCRGLGTASARGKPSSGESELMSLIIPKGSPGTQLFPKQWVEKINVDVGLIRVGRSEEEQKTGEQATVVREVGGEEALSDISRREVAD